MFTPENYSDKIQSIDFDAMPEAIRQGHAFIQDFTEGKDNWEAYYESDAIKETVDIYFEALKKKLPTEPFPATQENKPKKAVKPTSPIKQKKAASVNATETEAKEIAKDFIRVYVLRGETVSQLNNSYMGASVGRYTANIRSNKIHITRINGQDVKFTFSLPLIHKEIQQEAASDTTNTSTRKANIPSKKNKPSDSTSKPVERIDEELKFIKRYVLMHGKVKTKEQILNFINSLQKAIVEKRIRKTSDHAEQIIYMQNSLIKLYNKMDSEVEIKLRDSVLSTMMQIAGTEKVRLSIAYLKRYISMQGKQITKEKAEKLLTLISTAMDKQAIPGNDPYINKLTKILTSLRTYLRNLDQNETLHIQEATLNGLQRALDGCGCGKTKRESGLQGIDRKRDNAYNLHTNKIMSSMDFSKMEFDTLGFTGKWLKLIGDPSNNFTAMIFGKPKMGKSYLCVDFAGYLARNHGKVLYIAREEGLDKTLQDKLNDKNVKHPSLFVTASLPEDLSMYDFIFLDSVNRMGLTPEDLRQLKIQYPEKSFISIFQSTKQGNFRGENSFQHDVDVVIEVPEKGKAVQMGRFNQGGEMDIFQQAA